MTKIDRPQAQALAAFIGTIRPDWDAQGVMAALAKAKDRGTVTEVAHAAIAAAANRLNRTPAVIALSGPHWTVPTADRPTPIPGPGTAPRCPVYGHEGYPAPTCPGCRSEWRAEGVWPVGTQHVDSDRTYTDNASRAAGEREEAS